MSVLVFSADKAAFDFGSVRHADYDRYEIMELARKQAWRTVAAGVAAGALLGTLALPLFGTVAGALVGLGYGFGTYEAGQERLALRCLARATRELLVAMDMDEYSIFKWANLTQKVESFRGPFYGGRNDYVRPELTAGVLFPMSWSQVDGSPRDYALTYAALLAADRAHDRSSGGSAGGSHTGNRGIKKLRSQAEVLSSLFRIVEEGLRKDNPEISQVAIQDAKGSVSLLLHWTISLGICDLELGKLGHGDEAAIRVLDDLIDISCWTSTFEQALAGKAVNVARFITTTNHQLRDTLTAWCANRHLDHIVPRNV